MEYRTFTYTCVAMQNWRQLLCKLTYKFNIFVLFPSKFGQVMLSWGITERSEILSSSYKFYIPFTLVHLDWFADFGKFTLVNLV